MARIEGIDAAYHPASDAAPLESETVHHFDKGVAWFQAVKPFIFVEMASLVLILSSVAVWDDFNMNVILLKYALAVPTVALGTCLVIQTAEFAAPGSLKKTEQHVSIFLFLWWFVGTGIITFIGPFVTTSNGWLSAWAGLLCTTNWALNIDSVQFKEQARYSNGWISTWVDLLCTINWVLNISSSQVKEHTRGRQMLGILFMCSLTIVLASIDPIRYGFYGARATWGLLAGAITMVACVYLIKAYDDIKILVMKLGALLFFAIWLCIVGVCTFEGPFRVAGNGLFASWGGFVATVIFGIDQLLRDGVV